MSRQCTPAAMTTMATRVNDQAPSENISAIRISVTNNELRRCHKITLKGMYGN